MIFSSKRWLQKIEQDLFSDQQPARVSAALELVKQVGDRPRIQEAALELFRRCIQTESDPWIVVTAARGVEKIVGPVAARETWLALLESSNDARVAVAAMCVEGPFYVPVMLDLLRHRTSLEVRAAAICKLGRLQDPIAFDALIEHLATPGLKVGVIVALGELGDTRAKPYLGSLLEDRTELEQPDDRGCVQHVCDLAASAIRRMEYVAASKEAGG